MAIPIVRPAFGSDLMPYDIAPFVFEEALNRSVVMDAVRKIPLPGNGVAIPVVTGKPSAGWVSEAGRKPVSDATIGQKEMVPKKLAVIVPFSKEYIRDERVDLFEMIRPLIGEAFARAFDEAAIKNTGTPFPDYFYETTNSVELGTAAQADGSLYRDLLTGLQTVAVEQVSGAPANWRVDTFIMDTRMENKILAATDTTGRPLFIESQPVNQAAPRGTMLGRPVYYSNYAFNSTGSLNGVGFDSTQWVWGAPSELTYDITDQASIDIDGAGTMLNLWQQNLVALLAEAEFGFLSNNVESAVKFADATSPVLGA
jgi:HK97 family phage major capsid protein